MTRACDDCGIPRWADCECDPRAGTGHPDPRNYSLPERPREGDEGPGRVGRCSLVWLSSLVVSLGELAQEHNQGAQAGLSQALDAHIRLALRWREERDAA